MYNSLPWEEDITRGVCVETCGISNPEGISLFSLEKKGDIWWIVDAFGGTTLSAFVVFFFLCTCAWKE